MPLRLMCITAHPDDECGGFAGALMQAHARGFETSVLCLTEGRAASNRGAASNDHELGKMRRREFSEALRILDVDHGEIFDYPDGRLAEQNFLEVTAKQIERIRHYRPQIVLTFGPDGNVNLHPDHTMVSFFATAAFHWAGRDLPLTAGLLKEQIPYQPQKLYYSMAPFLVRKTAEQTRQTPLCPASLVLKLGDLTPRKIQAFHMHTTQVPILDRLGKTFEDAAGEERYLLISAPGIRLIHPETSMFEGLSEEPGQPQSE